MSQIKTWGDVRREVAYLISCGIGMLVGLAYLGLCVAVPIVTVGAILKWFLGYC